MELNTKLKGGLNSLLIQLMEPEPKIPAIGIIKESKLKLLGRVGFREK
jgi:hypothetical protein